MPDELVEDLLGGIGIGDEELRDPREGDYEATIEGALLVKNDPNVSWPYSVIVTYGGMSDVDGRSFSLDDRVPLPDSETDAKIQRWFLRTLHDLGLVVRSDKRARFADTEEQRQAFVKAFTNLVGARIPVRIKENKEGFVNVSLRRQKQ